MRDHDTVTHPAPSNATSYDQWFDGPWGRYAFTVEAAAVTKSTRGIGARRTLDTGCGTGRFTTVLAATSAATFGSDPDPDMLEVARARVGDRIACAPVEALPFPDGTFDLTAAITVLEFVADPAAATAELARVTRDGGRIIIGALNPRSPWGLANRRRLRSGLWCQARFLTRRELRQLAAPGDTITLRSSLYAPGVLPGLPVIGPVLEALGRVAPGFGAFQVLSIDKAPR
ncbi:MAG: class I SAM-dependent methyltransferase [Acidimicrobiales bacterium]